MQLNYVYRQYDDYYVGHLIDFPEYETQGKTIGELEAMLRSLYTDLMSFEDEDWYKNIQTGVQQPIPRHHEINEMLAKSIIKKLSHQFQQGV